jgi:hypothetical protein
MKIFAAILLSSITIVATNVNASDVGVGVKAGTLGYGADFSVTLTKKINARISLTTLSIDSQAETVTVGDASNEGTISATADIDFGSSALLFDWHVFDGTFHLTAGLVKADIGVNFSGSLGDSFTIDGQEVRVSDVSGPITGDVKVSDSYKPYIGLGWGRKSAADSGFSFSAELGAAFVDPEVRLNGTVASSRITQAELDERLDAARNSVKNDLADLKIWPVVSIGVNYAF